MRLLHTADWHLGRMLEGRSRINEQAQFLDELCDIADDQNVDAILMAGDVFDTVNPPAAAEELFYESVSKLTKDGKRPIIIIAGNHDNPDRLAAASPLATRQGITLLGYPTTNIHQIMIPTKEEILEIAALPYPSESRLKALLSESQEETAIRKAYDERIQDIFLEMSKQFSDKAVNVAMSHIYVAGGNGTESERPIEVGGAYTVAAPSLPEKAQYVALGHLHRPQNVKKANTLARYSGSPLAFSFSEAGYTKSVTILDVEPHSEPEMSEIYLSSGKPLVRWKAEEGVSQVYQWLEEGRDSNAWIDLEIHLDHALSIEEIHRLRKCHSGFIHIRPVFEDLESTEVKSQHANLPIDELFKRFYERQTGGAQPEQELVELFLDLVNEEEKEEVQS